MLIGELSRRTGVSKDTIRFYEKEELLNVDHCKRNTYKEYSEASVSKLHYIKNLQSLGFSLKEVGTFIQRWKEEDASCATLQYTLQEKIGDIEQQIARLVQMKSKLTHSLSECRKNNCEFSDVE